MTCTADTLPPPPPMPSDGVLHVLSLGAGVQSSTLLLMAVEGELRVDVALFADTQWEPAGVYRHLDYLTEVSGRAGIPVVRVTHGNLRANALMGHPSAWMPLHAYDSIRGHVMLKRQCTNHYKIKPIKRTLRSWGISKDNPCVLIKGISYDEAHRMRDPDVLYYRFSYPLVDMKMTRRGCLRWLSEHGYPEPPKSSCIGCPFRDRAAWQRMRLYDPESWRDAVDFDKRIRELPRKDGAKVYLHSRCAPLEEAVPVSFDALMESSDDGFGNECAGVCGV